MARIEELYKIDLNHPDNHNGVITDLDPDILECEFKWPSGSITMNKASGGDGIPVELFQILKDGAVKVLHSIWPANLENTAVATGLEKSVFISIPQKGSAKECSNNCTTALISHTSKVMLKILQAKLQQYVNRELQLFKSDLEKAEEPDIKLSTSTDS